MDFVFDGPIGETPWPIKILLLQLYNSTLSFIEIWEKIQCQNNYINIYRFCEVLMAPQGVSANQNTIIIIA